MWLCPPLADALLSSGKAFGPDGLWAGGLTVGVVWLLGVLVWMIFRLGRKPRWLMEGDMILGVALMTYGIWIVTQSIAAQGTVAYKFVTSARAVAWGTMLSAATWGLVRMPWAGSKHRTGAVQAWGSAFLLVGITFAWWTIVFTGPMVMQALILYTLESISIVFAMSRAPYFRRAAPASGEDGVDEDGDGGRSTGGRDRDGRRGRGQRLDGARVPRRLRRRRSHREDMNLIREDDQDTVTHTSASASTATGQEGDDSEEADWAGGMRGVLANSPYAWAVLMWSSATVQLLAVLIHGGGYDLYYAWVIAACDILWAVGMWGLIVFLGLQAEGRVPHASHLWNE